MTGTKTVEVKHLNTYRTGIFFTDMKLEVGDIVVYDEGDEATDLHVGLVTNTNPDPDMGTASAWVIDTVDVSWYQTRLKIAKGAQKLKAKLDAIQDIELLRLVAQNDPETKEILDNYMMLIRGTSNLQDL